MNEEEALLLKKLVEKCHKDIFLFARHFLPHMLVSDVPEFHKDIYKIVRSEKRAIIVAPRGFAKSTVSSVIYPIWIACFGHLKDVCLISASEGLAIDLLRKVKLELEGNEKIKLVFGKMRTEKWSESHFITKTGVNFRAKGAGGQIRGFRPECIILDDIETDETVLSEEQRKKLKEWLFKACINALTPSGQFIVIGTILHPLSLLSDLLETDNGWVKRKYQGYIGGIQEAGHELWPSFWPHDKLQAKKREIGTFAFAAEVMNDPVSDEASPIKPEMIRYWKELPSQIGLVLAVDPAYSEEEKSDYKVCSLVGIDQQSNRYLVNYVRTHESQKLFFDAILNMWVMNKNTCTAIGIPNSGTEKSFFNSFLDYAHTQRKLYPPVVELTNSFISGAGASVRGKKNRIIASLQPLFEAGKYFIHESHHEAREELLTIGASRWDDLVDTLSYAEQILTPVFLDPKFEKRSEFSPVSPKRQMTNYGVE